MKLYTEEQVRDMLELTNLNVQFHLDTMIPIELPSDEEVDKFLLDNSYEYGYGYRDAIDWIKKQILNQNK